MENKNFVMVVLVALFVLVMGIAGFVFAVGAETQERGNSQWFSKSWKGHREGCRTWRGDLRERRVEGLELPEDASTEQIREALKQQRESQHEERLKRIRDKLSLPADASEEQVKEALQKWRKENKDLIVGFGHKRWRFIRWKFIRGAYDGQE